MIVSLDNEVLFEATIFYFVGVGGAIVLNVISHEVLITS